MIGRLKETELILQRMMPGAEGAYLSPSSNAKQDPAAVEKACQQFESFFIYYLFKVMRQSIPKAHLIDGGRGEDISQTLMDQEMATKLASSGGIGLATMLMNRDGSSHAQGIEKIPVKPGPAVNPEKVSFMPPVNGQAVSPLDPDWPSLVQETEKQRVPVQPGLVINPEKVSFMTPVDGQKTSPYGMREDPFTGEPAFHHGIDVAAREGAPVRASASGLVIQSGVLPGYGKCVIIEHSDGYTSLYAHLRENQVAVGDRVEAGQTIGLVGKTGRATGPHLHFEVRKNDRAIDPGALLSQTTALSREGGGPFRVS